jgi:type I restriction enzyme S subunit
VSTTLLPPNWKEARVGDILTVRNGYAVKSSDYSEQGVPLIRQSDINGDTIDISGAKRVPARLLQECRGYLVREDDLLIGMSGSLGKIGRYVDSEPGIQNQRTGLLVLKPSISAGFAKLVLKFVERQIVAEGKGIAVQNVSAKEIESCTFPLAPERERERIVAEIEKQFTRLEAGVASLKRVQAALKRYRASMLKSACEGRLVPTEAELARRESRSYEPATILLAHILADRHKQWSGRGKLKESNAADSSDIPPLPEGWAWACVEQLASSEPNSITDGPFGSNLKTEHYTDSGPRVIRLQNIGDGIYVDEEAHISERHFQRLQKHRVFAHDVVIAGFGDNPPRSCIIPEALGPAIVKADCIRFKPHREIVAGYVNAALNCDPVRRRTRGMVHGVGRPRLNLGEIKSIMVPIPPFAEQQRIVAEVARRLSVIEELESLLGNNLERAARLRQSILYRAFSGELALESATP